jgi:hypothetical protein
MTAEELNEELQHFDYPPFIPNEESEVNADEHISKRT